MGALVLCVQRVVAQGAAELVVLPVGVHSDVGAASAVGLDCTEHRIDYMTLNRL